MDFGAAQHAVIRWAVRVVGIGLVDGQSASVRRDIVGDIDDGGSIVDRERDEIGIWVRDINRSPFTVNRAMSTECTPAGKRLPAGFTPIPPIWQQVF